MILASTSPRRKQLLQEAGYKFSTASLFIEEDYPFELPTHEVAEYLSVKKNLTYREEFKREVILTADTTVIADHELLEKAANRVEAERMLRTLSGKMHQVITGVCVSGATRSTSFSVKTEVYFEVLNEDEIDFYISNFSPYDKAGAYGIQEWIGMIGIKKIVGSYYNVVGLPLFELYRVLKNDFGITPQ